MNEVVLPTERNASRKFPCVCRRFRSTGRASRRYATLFTEKGLRVTTVNGRARAHGGWPKRTKREASACETAVSVLFFFGSGHAIGPSAFTEKC